MDEHVYPAEQVYVEQVRAADTPHVHPPVMEELKEEARRRGLWNLFLPDPEHGPGLTNLEYAPLAEILGRTMIGSEACNCSAPDTGNMEVLHQFGSDEQKERWLRPLLDGEIRSGFAMTEPDVASSDATQHRAADGARRRRASCSTGASGGRPAPCTRDCRILIVMGKTEPEAPVYAQQSMVLVPLDTPGLEIVRSLPVFGYMDPEGHGELRFTDVRVPADERDRQPGRRLPDRPGAARAGSHPPLHARGRRGRAGAGADVQARRRARDVRQAGLDALEHPRLDRRGAHRAGDGCGCSC